MTPQGKGVFLWQIKRVKGGDANAIALLARNARMTHVLIKVADGKYSYNITDGVDKVPATVAALRSYGVQPWGWQYVYGSDPVDEAKKAIERVKQFNLTGFVVNAEGQFKAAGMDKVAVKYMQELRKGLPSLPIGLSSYRYPSYHKDFPFKAFLDYCDFNMPQVYWIDLANPGEQLVKSVTEFRALMPGQPIVPTGAVFSYGDWEVTPAQLSEFLNKARELNLPGANFWEMASAFEQGVWWRTIRDHLWGPSEPPTAKTPEILARYINALDTNDPAKPTALYGKYASKHTHEGETREGRTNIYTWYDQLLKNKLPSGRFNIASWSQTDDKITFRWLANSPAGSVRGGQDTIVLSTANPRQISTHTTAFTISDPKSVDEDVIEGEAPKAGPIPV